MHKQRAGRGPPAALAPDGGPIACSPPYPQSNPAPPPLPPFHLILCREFVCVENAQVGWFTSHRARLRPTRLLPLHVLPPAASAKQPELRPPSPRRRRPFCAQHHQHHHHLQATSPVSLEPGASWAATTAMAFASDPLEDFCAGNPEEPECLVYDE